MLRERQRGDRVLPVSPGRHPPGVAERISVSAPTALGRGSSRILDWCGPRARPSHIGLAAAALLIGAIGLWEAAFGRFGPALAEGPPHGIIDQIRISLTHAIILAYLIGATAYTLRRMDDTLARLRPHLANPAAAGVARARSRRPWVMRGWALLGVVASLLTTAISPGEEHFNLRVWGPETVWHRVLAVGIGFWLGRLIGLGGAQSIELSRLAKEVREVDLLTLEPLVEIGRFGLSNALIAAGFVATYALFLVDAEYLYVVPFPFVGALAMASLGLFAPLLGARRRIQAAKAAELEISRARMRASREALATGVGDPHLDEWVAWEARIAAVREWPLDAGSFGRFALYLLIPLGSWSGGALVERLLDLLLR
jgi:hypothetical protein